VETFAYKIEVKQAGWPHATMQAEATHGSVGAPEAEVIIRKGEEPGKERGGSHRVRIARNCGVPRSM
jgi:hypothetical protein